MKDLLRRFGQRVRELRSQRGWSQEDFADVCGVHRTYMGHIERGEKNVSFGSIVRVANALSVSLSELFAGIEAGEPSKAQPTSGGKRRSKTGVSGRDRPDRQRVLREAAILERTARTLKEIALAEKGKPVIPERTRGRKSD